jgi:replication-associated recombination protein RarA
LPDRLGEKIYYEPSERGYEIRIREFLARAREKRKSAPRRKSGDRDDKN